MTDEFQEPEHETEITSVQDSQGPLTIGQTEGDDSTREADSDHMEQSTEASLPAHDDTEQTALPDSEVVKEFEETEEQIDDVVSKIQEAKNYVSQKRQSGFLTEEEKLQLEVKCTALIDHMTELDTITVHLSELLGLEPSLAVEDEVEAAPSTAVLEQPPPTPAPTTTPAEAPVLSPPAPTTPPAGLQVRLPRVVVTGLGEGGLPGIVVLPKPVKDLDASPASQPQVMLEQLSSELSLSYSVQEKLVLDNEHLENVRSQLVETIMQRDIEVEQLEKKVDSLQKDMWLMHNENKNLSEQLAALRSQLGMDLPSAADTAERDLPSRSKQMPEDMAAVIRSHANQMATLERQLNEMTAEVEQIQEELKKVEQERERLREQRKLLKCISPSVCTPLTCPTLVQGRATGLLSGGVATEDGDQQHVVDELAEQYSHLQHDLATKVKEASALRVEVDSLKDELVRVRAHEEEIEASHASALDRLRRAEAQLLESQGARGKLRETEAALGRTRQDLQQAQLDAQEARSELQEQASLCAKYRAKYLAGEQLAEDLRRHLDATKSELVRSATSLGDELQRIRAECQEKLHAVAHLPEMVAVLQRREREATQARLLAEASVQEVRRELHEAMARAQALQRQLEETSSGSQLGQDHCSVLQARVATLDARCQALTRENASLREKAQSEELELDKLRKLVEERDLQVQQQHEQLQLMYENSTRNINRAKDAAERQRASFLDQMHDLERELAQARVAAVSAQNERDDIRAQLNSQVRELTDNFQHAQLRIQSLQGHVNMLKSSCDEAFDAEQPDICLCDHPL